MLWHYTVGDLILRIVETGTILRERETLAEGDAIQERLVGEDLAPSRPAVWFTTGGDWDPTADKSILANNGARIVLLTTTGTEAVHGGLFRIGVDADVAPIGWTEFRRTSGETASRLNRLAKSALRQGVAVNSWRVSWEPVPRAAWRTIERRDAGKWKECSQPWNAASLRAREHANVTFEEMCARGWVKDVI